MHITHFSSKLMPREFWKLSRSIEYNTLTKVNRKSPKHYNLIIDYEKISAYYFVALNENIFHHELFYVVVL